MSDGIHSEVRATLLNHRMTGQTTTCIGVLLQNPKARMVVHSMSIANDLARQYPLAKDRFVTVEQLQVGIRGFNGPLVYDTMAVVQLMDESYRAGKKDVLKESVKPDVDISHKVDYNSAREFLPVLKVIAQKLDAFIFVIKK